MIENLLSWTQYLPALFKALCVALSLTGLFFVIGHLFGLLLA